MTGEDLYEELKTALNSFGIGFRGMAQVKITLKGEKLRVSYKDKEYAFKVPQEKKK